MKIAILSERAKLCFAKAIVANELGNQMSLVYKFSDPDGVRTGKSGWSFGIVQYDINNNVNAIHALQEMNFTTDEIKGLKAQTLSVAEMSRLEGKLLAHREVVDKWDRLQLADCLTWPKSLCAEIGVEFASEDVFLHVADYHNQFGMSRGGKMYRWLQSAALSSASPAVTAEMVRDFKYTTVYGIKQKLKPADKDDVARRYNNLIRICREA